MTADDLDRDVRRALRAPGLLDPFNAAGVLAPADVHAARTLTRLTGEAGDAVLLACALAVRAPRLQHVCLDLAGVRDTVTAREEDPVDVAALPWPDDPAAWREAIAASPLVATGMGAPDDRPLRLVGDRLYLDRYWRYEQRVVAAIARRAEQEAPGVDRETLDASLERLFGRDGDLQRAAAEAAILGRLAVVAGGPGTGKTSTIARILALLADQADAAGAPLPRVALTAPTGKAAQRMEASLADALDQLDERDDRRAWLAGLEASTIHRLLRQHPGNQTRFRHDALNPLPHDVVVVDETSMASLALTAKLIDAVRDDARLVLVGDPEQLASVEAGSVLGDLVGPATAGERPGPGAAAPRLAERIVVLRRVHRFRADSGIADLAAAIQDGAEDAAVEALASRPDIRWIPEPAEAASAEALEPVRARVIEVGRDLLAAARAGDARTALAQLDQLRVLCAHRRGPVGVSTWAALVERWLTTDAGWDARDAWHVGRPVIVTRNDYQLGVLNGDVGVAVVTPEGGVAVAFPKGADVVMHSPLRLEHAETVHAMTVHKSQGSQFQEVVVVLPGPDSQILTRELLYTAATRAQRRLTVVGAEEAVRAAVRRRIQRASGLRETLWGLHGDGRHARTP